MNYLSGTTGYTIFEKGNKQILLLADIHDGVNYCTQNQSHTNISTFLNKHSSSYQIVLEEATNDPSLALDDLWPNAFHTRNLKLLKEKNDKIIPTDIRPYLIPFSWQILESNIKYKKLPIKIYLTSINEFFQERGYVYEQFILPYYEFLDSKNKKIILTLFKYIKNEFLFLKKYNNYSGKLLENIIQKDIEYLNYIDYINSLIMEYYILLLILSDKRMTIIHTGLAHSSRLKKFLTNDFHFKIIEDRGMTKIESYTGSDYTNACTPTSNDFKELFDSKKILQKTHRFFSMFI
jgi:hypothetical protein